MEVNERYVNHTKVNKFWLYSRSSGNGIIDYGDENGREF